MMHMLETNQKNFESLSRRIILKVLYLWRFGRRSKSHLGRTDLRSKKKKGNCDSGTINEHGGSLDKDWWMWWLLEIENQRQARRLGVVVMSSVYKWKRKEKEKERETNATRVSFLWTSECHVGLDSSEPNFGQKSNTLWICEEKKQTKHFEGTKNKFYPFG